MMSGNILVLLLSSLILVSWAARQEDLVDYSKVKGLPDDYDRNALMYSGYLKVGDTQKQLFYVFVQSKHRAATDPVVLWLNGGPGCSSQLGMWAELGPLVFPDGEKKMIVNPFPWNARANLLILESPAGVGFSFSTDPTKDYHTDDNTTASDSVKALVSFFAAFPEYQSNPFYITGESYAGMYIPFLSVYILNYNNAFDTKNKINLKGVAIGNPYTDSRFDSIYEQLNFFYERGLYDVERRDRVVKFCKVDWRAPDCQTVIHEIQGLLDRINIYDIYGKCYKKANEKKNDNPFSFSCYAWRNMLNAAPTTASSRLLSSSSDLLVPQEANDDNCIDNDGVRDFLNDADVRAALHVKPDAGTWEFCNTKTFSFTVDPRGALWTYPILAKANVDVLIFSGDADGCVPTSGTQAWVNHIHLQHGLRKIVPWRPWNLVGSDGNSQIAGFVEQYEGLTLLTIRGAGHMSPQWKRRQAQAMLHKFLHREKF